LVSGTVSRTGSEHLFSDGLPGARSLSKRPSAAAAAAAAADVSSVTHQSINVYSDVTLHARHNRPVQTPDNTTGSRLRGGSRILQGRVSNPSVGAPEVERRRHRGGRVWGGGCASAAEFFRISYIKMVSFYAFPVVFASSSRSTCSANDMCSFQKRHPNQKGGCPDTLDTPWIHPPLKLQAGRRTAPVVNSSDACSRVTERDPTQKLWRHISPTVVDCTARLYQGRRNRSGRPGGCRTNNLTNTNFYVHIISTFVNVN